MITYECNNVRTSPEYSEYESHLIIYKDERQIGYSIDGEPLITITGDFTGKEVEDESEYGLTYQDDSLSLSLKDFLDLSRILNWWQNDCGKDEPTDLLRNKVAILGEPEQ